jgi:hypothetical protein
MIAALIVLAGAWTMPGPSPLKAVGAMRADGPSATLTFPDRVSVRVKPFTQATTRTRQCGVRIEGPGARVQTMTLIGDGETEAMTCGGIKAFGRLMLRDGRQRIALLYRTYSPNVAGQTWTILLRQPSGWTDDTVTGRRLDDLPEMATVDRLRRALSR